MSELKIGDAINTTCPWSGDPIKADSLTLYNGAVVGFATRAAVTSSKKRSIILRRRSSAEVTKASRTKKFH